MMSAKRSASLATILFWVFDAGQIRAEPILDQAHVATTVFTLSAAIESAQSWAQTFTVGREGVLSRIDLQISKELGTPATPDLVFRILTTAGGRPVSDGSGLLFQSLLPVSAIPTWPGAGNPEPLTSIDVSAAAISVRPGVVLALMLERDSPFDSPRVLWRQGETPNYFRGNAFSQSRATGQWSTQPYDASFQTFVDVVPEPSSIALLGLGVAGVIGYVWRCKKGKKEKGR